MKNHYFLFFMLTAMFIACKKAPKLAEKTDPPVVVVPKDTTKIVSTKTIKIDSIRKAFALRSSKSIFNTISDSVWKDSTGITFLVELRDGETSSTFSLGPVVDERQLFPGSLIKGKSLDDFSFTPLTGYVLAPVTIYSSDYSFDILENVNASKKVIDDYIKKQLERAGSKQINSAQYSSGQPFGNYGEISLFSYYSWDFSSLLNLKPGEHRKIKKKNGLYSTVTLSLFSVTAETPMTGHFFGPGVNPASVPDHPLMIIDVTYGRSALIAFESDAPYNDIQSAFNRMMNKTATANDLSLFQNATITTFARGFKPDDMNQLKNAKGAELVERYRIMVEAGGNRSANEYGVPIQLILGKASEISAPFFKHKSKHRLDYPIN